MSDGMRRELAYLSSHATNRYFIPNWGIIVNYCAKIVQGERRAKQIYLILRFRTAAYLIKR